MTEFGTRGGLIAVEHWWKYKFPGRSASRCTSLHPYGRLWLRPGTSDLATFREIFVHKEYDVRRPELRTLLTKRYLDLLASDRKPLILDLGANIGLAGRYFLQHYPQSDVVLVEPSKENCAVLQQNLKGYIGASILQAAVARLDGDLKLADSVDQTTHNVMRDGDMGPGEVIRGTTIDRIVGDRRNDLFIVKIDIEGSEIGLFDVDPGWLSGRPVIMIEPHDGIFNTHGSLAGLLDIVDYREGMILTGGSTLTFVPRSLAASALQESSTLGS